MTNTAVPLLKATFDRRALSRDLLLVLVGFNLLILQCVVIREYTVLLRGTELAITYAIASFLIGGSIGFRLSARISGRHFALISLCFFLVHLTIPFSLRAGSAWLVNVGYGALVPPVLFAVCVLGLSSYYSVFLPMFVQSECDQESGRRLGRLYSLELVGALAAIATVCLCEGRQVLLMFAYHAAFVAILALAGVGRKTVALGIGALAVVPVWYSVIHHQSLGLVYEAIYDVRGGRPIYVVDSPYQRVEVVEDASNRRYLFLNGLNHYSEDWADEFNRHLLEAPIHLAHPRRVLTIGNVSPAVASRVASAVASLQSVEIDARVVEASRYFGTEDDRADRKNVSVIIDDGKHFLAHTTEKYDLIALDIPSPYTIQTALLQSREFFDLAKTRLTPRGVLSMGISGSLVRRELVSCRIAATLLDSFEDVIFVDSPQDGMTFAMASRTLPFSHASATAFMNEQFDSRQTVISRATAARYVRDVEAINAGNMHVVLESNILRLIDEYFR